MTPPPRASFNRNRNFIHVNNPNHNSVNKDFENKKFLKVMYGNLDSGLLNKKDEINCFIQERDPDIMIFNEILPKKHRKKKKLQLDSFNFDGFEKYLPSTLEGRGVVIYYKLDLSVSNVEVLSGFNFNESVWIRVKLKDADSLLIGNIYRSPSSSKENNAKLLSLLSSAVGMKDSHFLVIGDFNYGTIDWESMQSSESTDHCMFFIVC